MTRVRVLVVSAWEPWRLTDGALWILHHHLRHLARRHQFTVFAAGAPGAETSGPEEVRTLPEGVELRWFGTARSPAVDYALRRWQSERSGEPAQVHWVERPSLVQAVRDEVGARRPDVVHAFGWGTAGMWRYVDGVPVVHFATDAWDLNYGGRRLPRWRSLTDAGQHAKARAHERRHYPQLSAVVVVAEPDAEHLRALAPSARVVVIPNGVEAGPEPVPGPADDVLGFHGSFEAVHNVDAARVLVQEVLPSVKSRMPSARVLLVGRNPPREIRALSGPDVEVRADVPDVRAELDRMAVYVAPLTSGSGMKNKVLEAMAAGRAVVTTPLGAAGIGAGPGLVVADSAEDVARAAVALLGDRAERAAQGRAARRRVADDFTWESSARQVEALWEGVRAP